MSLVTGERIFKSFGQQEVLRNVSFTLGARQRAGLVGPNGQGKSTLLKIIAGVDTPTSGRVNTRAGLRIGYLAQDPPDLGNMTLEEAMHDVFTKLRTMETRMHELASRLALPDHASDSSLLASYGRIQHDFELAGGYTYAGRITRVLEGLELPRELWNKPLGHLSGGQRSRAHLGRLLLEQPDLLLLDEPTNHLDMASVEWLEGYLGDFNGAIVLVSHDRYFLDRVTDSTWEASNSSLECYKGSYSDYLPKRKHRFEERMKQWESQRKYIEETQEFIRRFIAGQRSKEAQGRRTRLERFIRDEAIEKPFSNRKITMRLRVTQRTGDIVLRLRDLKAGYRQGDADKCLVDIENLDVRRNQRVAILGPNGCGKTTLLRTILGDLPPLAGAVNLGSNVQVGYLSQTHAELETDSTALECVRSTEASVTDQRAMSLLGQVNLSGDEAQKRICELSGGQRSRVSLVRLMLKNPNVLILDEPTNHLDIPSQEVLQDVLMDFGGTIILVSHDRYLIQSIATTIWALDSGAIKVLDGNWDSYLHWRNRQACVDPAAEPNNDRIKKQRIEEHNSRRERNRNLNRARRRLEKVESEIDSREQALKQMDEALMDASAKGDIERISELGERHRDTQQQLSALMEEWEQLSLTLDC